MSDWMKNSEQKDIQTAIQTQTIQTALERNTSGLTDQAFQSYLTNAPIPRCYFHTISGTIPGAGAQTVLTWTAVGAHDPYRFWDGTSTFTIPIDGYYACTWIAYTTGSAGSYFQTMWALNGALVAEHTHTDLVAAAGNFQCGVTIQAPFVAGSKLTAVAGNSGAAAMTPQAALTHLSIVWLAPYNNYSTAGGN